MPTRPNIFVEKRGRHIVNKIIQILLCYILKIHIRWITIYNLQLNISTHLDTFKLINSASQNKKLSQKYQHFTKLPCLRFMS